MARTIACAAVAASFLFSSAAFAHAHYVINGKGDQVFIGNETYHNTPAIPTDDGWAICGGDPAWYGHEVAHHGRDAGDPGLSDGCYVVPGGLTPGDPNADRNPAID